MIDEQLLASNQNRLQLDDCNFPNGFLDASIAIFASKKPVILNQCYYKGSLNKY